MLLQIPQDYFFQILASLVIQLFLNQIIEEVSPVILSLLVLFNTSPSFFKMQWVATAHLTCSSDRYVPVREKITLSFGLNNSKYSKRSPFLCISCTALLNPVYPAFHQKLAYLAYTSLVAFKLCFV